MSEHLTSEQLDNIQRATVDKMKRTVFDAEANLLLCLITQARRAPDPQALPLSVAMREARRLTESGTETWIHYQDVGPIAPKHWLFRLDMKTGEWLVKWDDADWPWVRRNQSWSNDQVEKWQYCLVTPAEGDRLLRGGE